MALCHTPRVNAFFLELLDVLSTLGDKRRLEKVLHYLQRTSVVHCHLCTGIIQAFDHRNCQKFISKHNSANVDLIVARQVFPMLLNGEDALLFGLHYVAEGSSEVELSLFLLVKTLIAVLHVLVLATGTHLRMVADYKS